MTATPKIVIPSELKPSDGRFGCGPSKVRPQSIEAFSTAGAKLMGTSHRQPPVRFLLSELRNGLAEMFALPDGYEVIVGNGGTTAFWDAATFGLIDQHSQHLRFGEFSSKFASCAEKAPHVSSVSMVDSDFGDHPDVVVDPSVDFYALTHNETSTGVAMEIQRPADTDGALIAVDATSAAGGLAVDVGQTDIYYFAPQKCFGSDGGLWIAFMSPAAIERVQRLTAERWVPDFLNLSIAIDNSRKDQTYNTPAIATIFLANQQVLWMLENGGLWYTTQRTAQSASTLYSWAEASAAASPFVTDPAKRSSVVGTIDLDDRYDASVVCDVLRANGIVDTDGYRKLGRNQMRVAMFPAIDPADIAALTGCIDYVLGELDA